MTAVEGAVKVIWHAGNQAGQVRAAFRAATVPGTPLVTLDSETGR